MSKSIPQSALRVPNSPYRAPFNCRLLSALTSCTRPPLPCLLSFCRPDIELPQKNARRGGVRLPGSQFSDRWRRPVRQRGTLVFDGVFNIRTFRSRSDFDFGPPKLVVTYGGFSGSATNPSISGAGNGDKMTAFHEKSMVVSFLFHGFQKLQAQLRNLHADPGHTTLACHVRSGWAGGQRTRALRIRTHGRNGVFSRTRVTSRRDSRPQTTVANESCGIRRLCPPPGCQRNRGPRRVR